MAKKKAEKAEAASEGPNKSARIREYMIANPKAGPKEVAQALVAEGLKVTAAYVSTVKALDKKSAKKKSSGGPGRPGRKPAAAAASTGGSDLLSSLLQAKKLAEAMGGVANAKAALDALSKLGL